MEKYTTIGFLCQGMTKPVHWEEMEFYDYLIVVRNENNQMVFQIKIDGTVEFGPGFISKNEASKLFLSHLGSYLEWCRNQHSTTQEINDK